MDVNVLNSIPYSVPRPVQNEESAPEISSSLKKAGMPAVFGEKESRGDQIREEVMMNLEQVQNFLYMLIGSKLRIEHGHKLPGSTVNTTV